MCALTSPGRTTRPVSTTGSAGCAPRSSAGRADRLDQSVAHEDRAVADDRSGRVPGDDVRPGDDHRHPLRAAGAVSSSQGCSASSTARTRSSGGRQVVVAAAVGHDVARGQPHEVVVTAAQEAHVARGVEVLARPEDRQLVAVGQAGVGAERAAVAALVAQPVEVHDLPLVGEARHGDRDVGPVRAHLDADLADLVAAQAARGLGRPGDPVGEPATTTDQQVVGGEHRCRRAVEVRRGGRDGAGSPGPRSWRRRWRARRCPGPGARRRRRTPR